MASGKGGGGMQVERGRKLIMRVLLWSRLHHRSRRRHAMARGHEDMARTGAKEEQWFEAARGKGGDVMRSRRTTVGFIASQRAVSGLHATPQNAWKWRRQTSTCLEPEPRRSTK